MKTDRLSVYFDERLVGTLVLQKNKQIAFSYDKSWIESGFSISPFSLPLKEKVFVPEKHHFDGLYGVFADSLPDAWGRLLVERILKEHQVDLDSVTVLDRLAIVGNSGMGALTFRPEITLSKGTPNVNLDEMADACQKLLISDECDDIDRLYQLGGSSGGARPKITVPFEGNHWLIKFPSHMDKQNVGLMEYDYSVCAKRCNINMSETRLFRSEKSPGYFGTKRFDHYQTKSSEEKRYHILTAAALLELDFRSPCLDYHSLMKLTQILTRNNRKELEEMYRRMCFNVYAHNRDDHAKNFSFTYLEDEDCFSLSPAYDLTYSSTYFGEHTTSVNGNGKNPSEKDLIAVGQKAGLPIRFCKQTSEEIHELVMHDLSIYLK